MSSTPRTPREMISSGARTLKKKLSFERTKKEPPTEAAELAAATAASEPTTPRSETGTPREKKGSMTGKLLRKLSFNRDKKKAAEPADEPKTFKISLDANIPMATAPAAESAAPVTALVAPGQSDEPVSSLPVAAPTPVPQAAEAQPAEAVPAVPASTEAAVAEAATAEAKAAEEAAAAETAAAEAKAVEEAAAAEANAAEAEEAAAAETAAAEAKAVEEAAAAEAKAAEEAAAAATAVAAADAERISTELVKGAIEQALAMADEADSKAAPNDSSLSSPRLAASPPAAASPDTELSRAPSTLAMVGVPSSAKGNPASPQAIETMVHAVTEDKVPEAPLAPPAPPADLCTAMRACFAH